MLSYKRHFPLWQWTASAQGSANHSNVQVSCYLSSLVISSVIVSCVTLPLPSILIFIVQQVCWSREDSYGVIRPVLHSIWSLSHSWIFGNIIEWLDTKQPGGHRPSFCLPLLNWRSLFSTWTTPSWPREAQSHWWMQLPYPHPGWICWLLPVASGGEGVMLPVCVPRLLWSLGATTHLNSLNQTAL